MDNKRARQIIESHGVIEVLHLGKPVWIEEVQNNEARVKYLESGKMATINLKELTES